MAVFRIERTKDYTVMSNHHLRNHELSLKAKGLLSMMLSLPDDWNYHRTGTAITDTDMNYLLLYLEETYGLTSEKKIAAAIGIVANENGYHPSVTT